MMSSIIRVKRDGRSDLLIEGEQLANVTDLEFLNSVPSGEWWELSLIRSKTGQYVLSSVQHIGSGGGTVRHAAFLFPSMQSARQLLSYNTGRQARLAKTLLERAGLHSRREKMTG
ncbi:hypothetical protein DQK91_01450 [Oceanidesulfovibrio marinus]|uniref:Uncharacterized protein n=2 Tax=Oceanidesulfovibrio marinus TaxID=370038 RepID=A0A6P1ZPZ8_9BACT|nr:hypothetical protein DQK91_01450 [Oceanidesulfovibrio marinus]